MSFILCLFRTVGKVIHNYSTGFHGNVYISYSIVKEKGICILSVSIVVTMVTVILIQLSGKREEMSIQLVFILIEISGENPKILYNLILSVSMVTPVYRTVSFRRGEKIMVHEILYGMIMDSYMQCYIIRALAIWLAW